MADKGKNSSSTGENDSARMSLEAQKKAKQRRGTAKAKLTRKLDKFHEYMLDQMALEILEERYESVVKAYDEVELANEQYCNLLDENCDAQLIEEANVYIKALEDRKCAAHVIFVKVKDEMQVKKVLKVKPIDVPRFHGDVRDYSNFKRDFFRLMQSNYGKDPFVLRQCLSGEALDTVRGADHDFDKMFERLDETFGNSRTIIDVVVEDIRSIKPISEGDSESFIRKVDKIEQCYLYLDQMSLASELNTANMTSQIEKLLPPTQKREWVKLAECVGNRDLFGKLLEYLLSEKKSMKYLNANIRSNNNIKAKVNYTCTYEDQRSTKQGRESDVMERIAGLENAITNITDLFTKITEENAERNRNKISDNTRLHRCWYHGSDGHDILDCTTFQNLSINDRMESVKKKGICFNCLKGVHIARKCLKKSRCNTVDVNNESCGKLHHTIIHEGFITGYSFVSLKRNGVLFMVNKIKCGNQELQTLFDSGADITMIRNDVAKALGLKGKCVRLAVTKLGDKTVTYSSKEYDLVLTDKDGNDVNVTAYGIDDITSQVVKETVAENLQLRESQFGMCVYGSHPDIVTLSVFRSNPGISINHVSSTISDYDISVEPVIDITAQINDFFTIEHLGTDSVARLKGTEKRLMKLGSDYAQAYNDQILDMTKCNVIRKLSDEEVKNYVGPVTYIQHHEVLKPGSISTPLRIVFDSSAKYMGQSLNSFWAKGPNILNSMFGILLRFREKAIGIAGDISKMYNCIKLPELEQHVHRFVWRNLQSNRKPDHYVMTCMGFGDRPSGIIAMLALRHTAEMSVKDFPEASRVIMTNSYVDDIIHSVESKAEAFSLIRDIENVLSKGSFKIKPWTITGDNERSDFEVSQNSNERILGLNWQCNKDVFYFKTKLNFSPKYKGVRTEPDLNKLNFVESIPSVLTKRVVVSQMCSVYDPLGFLLPFTLKAKILLRDTVKCDFKLGWDDPLPSYLKEQWVSYFCELFGTETLDSSTNAYGAVAYARWELESGAFESRLIVAKSRIAPSRQLSIPRLELCGAVIACRMRKAIEDEMTYKFSSVMHITDSSIVRAQIQKESYGFGTFVATRIAEVQSKSDPNEWWWIASGLNPADLLTRPQDPLNVGVVYSWKYGPEFMALPLEVWPISQSVNCELPDRIHVNLAQYSVHEETIIDASKFNNYNMLIAVTARIFNIVKEKSFKGVLKKLEPRSLKEAERFWIMQAQKSLPENWKKCFQRLGPFQAEDGTIMVGERMERWLKHNWNQDSFILLPGKHPFTVLYISYLHRLNHAGVDVTLCKLQSKFWVPSARKIIRSIKRGCILCRKLDAKVEGQRMGQISDERMSPCPAFYHTAVDIFGHFQIKDNVKKRTTGKAYGVIFNCIVTRAVYIDVVDGYDTYSFLKCFRRFTAVHGYPHTVHSDLGSQLVSASKELKSDNNWNIHEITEFGAKEGLKWKFNRSADAAWQNGRKWQRDYFPTLIVRQKWHTDKRNVQPGDIVLIKDTNVVRGKWKMGQVVDTETGRDNKVRDVSIRYKIQRPGKYKGQSDTVIKRSVHKLVVLLPVEEQ
ncbi:uncharacterized protein [Palaemon carinicauda]|uniref:uncharacterized protein n=1 Tax=Palaemon carinicauda TaxID=392227 RepID=UPI0035B64E34